MLLRTELAKPGWYAIPREYPQILHALRDAGFEIVFAFAYSYARVTSPNRLEYRNITQGRKFMRVKDIEIEGLIASTLAVEAVKRYPGSKKQGQFTKADILRILQEQKGLCICGVDIRFSYTIDHIIPRSLAGTNNPENIQLLCKSCNSSKSDRSMEEWVFSQGLRQEISRRGQRTPPKEANKQIKVSIRDSDSLVYRIVKEWLARCLVKGYRAPKEIVSALETYMPLPDCDQDTCYMAWIDKDTGEENAIRIRSRVPFSEEQKNDFFATSRDEICDKFPAICSRVDFESEEDWLNMPLLSENLQPYFSAMRAARKLNFLHDLLP